MSDVQPERSINWHMGWPEDTGPFPTQMVETIARALGKPIRELDVREITLIVGQNLVLEYAVPVALEFLSSRPMADGGNYAGDLLHTCLNIEPEFWRQNSSMFNRFKDLISNLGTVDRVLNAEIDAFLKLKIAPTKRDHRRKRNKGKRP